MFNILRAHDKKFKDKNHITQAVNHNMRLHIDEHLQERVYSEKSHLNEVLHNPLDFDATKGGADFQQKLFEFYANPDKETDPQKIKPIKFKPDSVYMLEFMVSASPEFFQNSTAEVIEDWKKTQLEFLQEQFGSNLKLVVLHNDESTPHLHVFVSTELKSVKKYKNQKGEFFKESWSLNAKRSNPEFLTKLHDAHAAKNDRFGLIRGVEGSTAEHVSLKDYTKRLKGVLKPSYMEKIRTKVSEYFEKKSNWGYIRVATATKILTPFLNELQLSLDALRFHIKDKENRGKILEVEAERLKNKENELNLLLDQYTQVLQNKNAEIDDLSAKNKKLEKSNKLLSVQNQSQATQIVSYQNQLKQLKNKFDI